MQNGIHRGVITRIDSRNQVWIVIKRLSGENYEYGPVLAVDSVTGLTPGARVMVGFLEQNEAYPVILGTNGVAEGSLPGGGFAA